MYNLRKREEHPWSVTFNTESNTSPWVFFTFHKLYKLWQIVQSVSYCSLILTPNSGALRCVRYFRTNGETLKTLPEPALQSAVIIVYFLMNYTIDAIQKYSL